MFKHSPIIFRFADALAGLMLLVLPMAASATQPATQASPKTILINYGHGNRISYDMRNGEYSVFAGNKVIFSKISALARVNGIQLASGDYPARTYVKASIKDQFGTGIRHTITLKATGKPDLVQIFYTYPGREYFLTGLTILGKQLKSNDITPFTGEFIKLTGDVYSVFMPFDNDTFISYDAKKFTGNTKNTSAEAAVVYDNMSRAGVIAGSVEHMVWKTGAATNSQKEGANQIRVWAGYTDQEVNRDAIAHGEIAGDTLKSPLIFVGYFADWRQGLEEYGKANRLKESPYVFNWTKPTPVGWNSWGVMQEKLSYDKIIKVADFFADSLKAFRTGNTAYIDLDSYWDNLVRGGDFSKLKAFADHCLAKGLQPGIYWAPFVDWGYKGSADHTVAGTSYKFGDMWTKVGSGYHDIDGARALDPTHPGTRQRIAAMIAHFKECGFKMIKIDFLGHAAAESTHFYDPAVTTGMQAYRKGMEFLVDQLGDQMLIYAAISPNLATGRYVHTRRIACDAFKSISDTRYTLNSINYGWWQTYLYNYIDADHVVLSNQSEGENRARMLSAIITGTFITGDDFSQNGPWSARAKAWYQNKALMPIVESGKAFIPVDGNSGKGASELFTRRVGNYMYVAIFNYSDSPKVIDVSAARIGLVTLHKYEGTELLHGNSAVLINVLNAGMPARDALLYRFKLN